MRRLKCASNGTTDAYQGLVEVSTSRGKSIDGSVEGFNAIGDVGEVDTGRSSLTRYEQRKTDGGNREEGENAGDLNHCRERKMRRSVLLAHHWQGGFYTRLEGDELREPAWYRPLSEPPANELPQTRPKLAGCLDRRPSTRFPAETGMVHRTIEAKKSPELVRLSPSRVLARLPALNRQRPSYSMREYKCVHRGRNRT